MIYLVTAQQQLFECEEYKLLSVKESLEIMKLWNVVQVDLETDGKDAHLNSVLSVQFGNKASDIQMVVDASTINLALYKEVLESKLCILQMVSLTYNFYLTMVLY